MARSSTLAVILLGAALLQALTFVGPASPALRAGRAGRASLLVRRAASDETMGKVAEVIAEQLGVDKEKVTREATLTELGADSLDIVESVMALEEAFDIELPDEETTPLKNCGDVMESRVEMVAGLLQSNEVGSKRLGLHSFDCDHAAAVVYGPTAAAACKTESVDIVAEEKDAGSFHGGPGLKEIPEDAAVDTAQSLSLAWKICENHAPKFALDRGDPSGKRFNESSLGPEVPAELEQLEVAAELEQLEVAAELEQLEVAAEREQLENPAPKVATTAEQPRAVSALPDELFKRSESPDAPLQPAHEAHLPFLLHFLAEHHLSGAGLCRVSGTERASRLSRCALELDVVACGPPGSHAWGGHAGRDHAVRSRKDTNPTPMVGPEGLVNSLEPSVDAFSGVGKRKSARSRRGGYRELLRRAGQGLVPQEMDRSGGCRLLPYVPLLSSITYLPHCTDCRRQYNQLPSPSAGHVSVSRPGAAARTPAAVRHALHRWLRGGAAPVHEASEAFTEMAMEMANAWKIAQEKVQAPEVLWGLMGRTLKTWQGKPVGVDPAGGAPLEGRPTAAATRLAGQAEGYSNPADDPRSKDHSQEAEMEIDRGRSLERMWVKKYHMMTPGLRPNPINWLVIRVLTLADFRPRRHVGLGALNWAGALAAVRGQCRPGFAKLRRMTPAAQYAAFFGTDAEKACDALVSDLLKDEDDAGETDVPEERSGEVTLNESEEERRSPSGPPGLILSTTSAPNSLSSPSYFGAEQFRKNLALTLEDECLDDEIGEATAPESFQMFYPPVVAPPLGRGEEYDAWLAQLPSIGSANHFFGTCDRCCFHPKGRCHNGYNCQHCHYDHEKRKRKSKKKSTEREDLAHSIPATPPALGLMGPLEHCYPIPAPFPEPGAPVPPVPPGLPGLQAYPPWYPEPVPPDFIPPESHHAPAWEDYVLRLEEENRYLRGMLMQYGASLPPSVIPSHRGPQPMPAIASPVDPVSLNPMNPMLSPSAVPFCPGWSTDATREPVGSALPEM
ncbi:unnamed protein product [Durusdinium trenchii]|uniref:Acyl carrier protein n=1 Tax=Durusdinium trenchii TaxID=1381693 RepID=A0ABP0I269_9DINO